MKKVKTGILCCFSFLLLLSRVAGQHLSLESSKVTVNAIKKSSADYANDTAFLSAYNRHLFYLSHFRDTTVPQHLVYFDSIIRRSSLPVARAYFLLGNSYYQHTIKKNFKQALTNILEAIPVFEKMGYTRELANCYCRLSATLRWQAFQEDNNQTTLREGVLYGKMGAALGKEIRDTNIICTGLMFAANNYLSMDKPDSASLLLHEAETMVLKTKLNYPVDNNVWGTLAALYTRLGQSDKVIMYADRCLQTGLAENDAYSISSIYQLKGDLFGIYGKEKQYRRSINYLDSALHYAKKLNDISVMARVEQSFFTVYKASGDAKRALYALEQMTRHKDALRKQNETSIKADYELTQREKQITKLENEKLIANTRKQKMLIWLLALVGLLVAMAAVFFARNNYLLREKKKETEAALKKGQNIERKRMSADLHDNLGVQASAILHSAAVLKESPHEAEKVVDNLHDTAREMLVNLRETLWAMKREEVPAAELWIRIISFCKQLANHYKEPAIQVKGAAPKALVIDSPKALHILMIVQEAVHNAIKHAGARNIYVSGSTAEGNWEIEVKDDGKGFFPELAKQRKESYGLSNMETRAGIIGSKISIASEPDTGTTIVLKVPEVKDYPNGA